MGAGFLHKTLPKLEALVGDFPQAVDYQLTLAAGYSTFAQCLSRCDNLDGAVDAATRAVSVSEGLASRLPEVNVAFLDAYRAQLADLTKAKQARLSKTDPEKPNETKSSPDSL